MNTTHLVRRAAAFTLLLIAFAGCKKGDSVSTSIIGAWELRSSREVVTDNSSAPPTVTTTDSTYAPGTGSWIQFNEDKTYADKDKASGPTTSTGTYDYTNGKMIIQENGSSTKDTINVTVNGSTLSISQDINFGSFRLQISGTMARL